MKEENELNMKEENEYGMQCYRYMILVFMVMGILVSGCDKLESDGFNEPSEVLLKDNHVYTTPGRSTIIDLQSFVKSKDNVRLQISSQPRLGTLKSLGSDLLEYTPNSGIKEGKDAILFSIFGENNMMVKEDSINIFISQDSTGFPCSLQAINDYVYPVSDSIIIDVLGNDNLCLIDSTLIQVSFPAPDFVTIRTPYAQYGTAEVISLGRILYIPGPDFVDHDAFIYKISKPADSPNNGDYEEVSYAYVYISDSASTSSPDSIEIVDDYFTVDLDSVHQDSTYYQDSVFLDVKSNDVFPPESEILSFKIKVYPQGKVNYAPDYSFFYHFPEDVQVGFTDHFIYEVCTSSSCQEGEVTIEAK